MVQTTAHSSRPSSLSKALKKAVRIKRGRCLKRLAPTIVAGTTVWTITPQQAAIPEERPVSHTSRFALAAKRLGQRADLKIAPIVWAQGSDICNFEYRPIEAELQVA